MLVLLAFAGSAGAAKKTFTAGGFLLAVDGGDAAPVASVEGGNTVGQVTVAGSGTIPDKQIGGVVLVQPMAIRFTPGSAASLEGWIADGLLPGERRASGDVTLLALSGDAVSRRTFQSAGIRALSLPTLDTASNEPLTLTAVVQPTSTTYETDSSAPGAKLGAKAKLVRASDFRLSIDGLDTSLVSKIDAFTVTQQLSSAGVPQSVEVPNLTVALAASASGAWFAWFDDMVLSGGGEAEERDGKIELLSGNQKTAVATLHLRGVGIVSIGAERADGWVTRKGASSASERVRVDLYCEHVEYEPAP